MHGTFKSLKEDAFYLKTSYRESAQLSLYIDIIGAKNHFALIHDININERIQKTRRALLLTVAWHKILFKILT